LQASMKLEKSMSKSSSHTLEANSNVKGEYNLPSMAFGKV